jgi:Protein of unknown function (DUF3667)/Domain of unknown function (DUF4286)
MSASSGLIYEVTLTIERDIIDSFDGWLANHVEEMLAIPGFISANVFALDDDGSGHVKRVTQYFLDSEGDLDSYLADQATAMRQSAIDRFGEQFSATRRILRETDIADGHIVAIENCLNCGTALSGQYCGNCGQRSSSRLISIWELLSDAFGDLFELDSRIWKTLIPLLVRPGKLTGEYLQGRRARFMPPFRTYLVLSIVFFLLAFFNPQEDFGFLFEPAQETPQQTSEAGNTTDAPGNEVLDELIAEGIIPPSDNSDGKASYCELNPMDMPAMPDWLARRLTRERVQNFCEAVFADNGAALLDKLKDNIPAALFLLLPLMAFVLKVLYPLSKRYYVEHLLFVVHYHAFFFLILILQMLFSRLGGLLRLPDGLMGTALVATSLYVPVYLYKAMRRVYAQGHAATVPKFLGLAIAYFIGLTIIFGFAALFAAFSI